jgi:ESF2/ABP1 family protein
MGKSSVKVQRSEDRDKEVNRIVDFDDENDFDDSDDEGMKVIAQPKSRALNFQPEQEEDDDEEDDDENEEGEEDDEEQNDDDNDDAQLEDNDLHREPKQPKLKKFTPEQLEKQKKRIKKTGVCYLSKIPPYMKPSKLRAVMTRFGEVDRLFLKPEDTTAHQRRVKYGGNKKKNYTEGWVEFVNKKDAKLAAATLNANKLGGKKTSYYYDDIINIKYLSGFKWIDLTQQIAKETEARQAKLALELSQQQKLNKTFINNVEKSKTISKIQKKRKEKDQDTSEENEIRRSFKQRKVTSTRADAEDSLKEKAKPNTKLVDVLSKVF